MQPSASCIFHPRHLPARRPVYPVKRQFIALYYTRYLYRYTGGSRAIDFLSRHAALSLAALALAACAPFQPYSTDSSDRYYIVRPGDNIHSIAFGLETTPEHLHAANRWADPARLQAGMRLSIPGPGMDPNLGGQLPPATSNDTLPRASGYIWPLYRFRISSRFGNRRGRLHSGIDLSAPRGTPVRAAADGRVKYSGFRGGYGNMIVIDHGHGIETVYAHHERNLVAVGQRVSQGEVIGRVGRSGRATGYHLHFEYRRHGQALDPARRMQAAS